MSILLNNQEVFVAYSGGVVDAIVRAPNKETFEAVARSVDLYYEVDSKTGEWKLGRGVNIDHLGPVIITPATYDNEGNMLSSSVFDNRHHVNIRLVPPATSRLTANGNPKWHQWAIAWTQNGTLDPDINNNENAILFNQVALIDPDSISTPLRIWA